jgi:hypothetical protein
LHCTEIGYSCVGGKTRAVWNIGLEKALVDILHEHNNTYHKSQNGWSSETWNLMVKLFHARHPFVKFTKAQIQDKEKDLKRDYRMLKEARMQSGVGWNDSELKLQAEPHLWENLEKVSFPTLVVTTLVVTVYSTFVVTIYSTLVVIRSKDKAFQRQIFSSL